MTAIRLKNVCKTLGGKEIIRDVSLDIEPREFVVFVGPSGSGKSTLLRLVAGLEETTSGDILVGEQCVNSLPPSERNLAMVFQSYALYPHMSVRDNLAFGLKNISDEERDVRIRKAAEMLQITPYLDRKPAQLSGGQRQRVAIGRAIARQPKIFLFDEPLSNLDAALRVQTRVEIARLHQEMNTTMIYVTHDQVEAMTLADKIVLLREGRIEQVGAPMELYNHPRNLFVAGFLGSPAMNTLPVPVSHAGTDRLRVQLPGGGEMELPFVAGNHFKAGNFVTLGIRPEHIVIADSGSLKGQVALVESLGSEAYVHVTLPGNATMILRLPINHGLRVGDTVPLVLPVEHCHVFDAEENALPRSQAAVKAA